MSTKKAGFKRKGDTLIVQSCAVCSSPAPLKCAGCKHTRYCGSSCQKDDWKRHKSVCKKIQEEGVGSINLSFDEYVYLLENNSDFRESAFRGETPEEAAKLLDKFLELKKSTK